MSNTVNIVKCSNCNVVINELLAFIRNVMDYMDEESIHQLCTTSFSADDIIKAKSLLFDSMPNAKRMPLRRKQDKKRMSRDLDDIISLMKSADPQIFPVFVAKDLHLVPPVTFDHVDVTRFLKELLWLKNRLSVIEENSVTSEQFNLLKREVEYMKYASLVEDCTSRTNVNKRRGACLQNSFEMDSGPIGLHYEPGYVPINLPQTSSVAGKNSRPSTVRVSFDGNSSCDSISLTGNQNEASGISQQVESRVRAAVLAEENESGGCKSSSVGSDRKSVGEKERTTSRCGGLATSEMESSRVDDPASVSVTYACAASKPVATISDNASSVLEQVLQTPNSSVSQTNARDGRSDADASVKFDQVVGDSEWQIVRNKSAKRYKLIGQRGCAPTTPNGKFRAADVKVPLLISNVNKDTSEDDIINYIQEKTNESVSLKKINMRKVKTYNSYKLYVSKYKIDIFLNDNFWPRGITFRRFVHFLYKAKPENIVKVK